MHSNPFFAAFNEAHTAFRRKQVTGVAHREYLPELRRANREQDWWIKLLRNWGDPIC